MPRRDWGMFAIEGDKATTDMIILFGIGFERILTGHTWHVWELYELSLLTFKHVYMVYSNMTPGIIAIFSSSHHQSASTNSHVQKNLVHSHSCTTHARFPDFSARIHRRNTYP